MKKILLGVTGSIAAFKVPELYRLFHKAQFDVKIVLTSQAEKFVTPLALAAISENQVYREEDITAKSSLLHIELARWADFILIAPASANTLAKLAHGLTDNLLTGICLASRAPLILAPAMNRQMWSHIATAHNCHILLERGVVFLGPDSGEMASSKEGVGMGRLLDPVKIVEYFDTVAKVPPIWTGKHIVITAGPTREPIDPVRFLSNRSSGKMGYALAEAAFKLGAKVTLISGPVNLPLMPGITKIPVETSTQMLEASLEASSHADVFMSTAAVVDWHPKEMASQKIKKTDQDLSLSLSLNPDIVAQVKKEYPNLYVVAFAAETQDMLKNAQEKLSKKRVQMVIANDVSRSDIGFDASENEVTLLTASSEKSPTSKNLPKMSKTLLSFEILREIWNNYSRWKS